ncbi:MAG: AAA family ATPase [Anaerolineae bacterium]|nr:AAA family ATPase [Anaerolineae bacterium]
MACLSIRLLGPFQVTLDGQPFTAFESDKARALLAYLTVEAERPHRRESLAGLLWPERPEQAARTSLRHALYNLRHTIADRLETLPFLSITREAVQFNAAGDTWLDVAAFDEVTAALTDRGHPVSDTDVPHLESAVALYRGRFLEGFSIADSPAFEEWALFKREQLDRQALSAFGLLWRCYVQRGDYERAQACARRQLESDPWFEEAYRQLMRALALTGQRNEALGQYEACRRMLAQDLGVAPARETTALYERIRDGETREPGDSERMDAFSLSSFPLVLPTSLVARERQLASLNRFLTAALEGGGRVAFVSGSAGSGKSALLDGFARQAMAARGDLIVASGKCNAQSGIGDPYLPWREILGMLSGDIEPQRASGTITREHARRLWALLPAAVGALVEAGPGLVGRLLPGAPLAARAEAYVPRGAAWRAQLETLLRSQAARQDVAAPGMDQAALFEQVTRVLCALARPRPLLLLLDDLQWADAGSLSLLFHLGRRLAGSRILIVGAYRPAEVALGRPAAGGGAQPAGLPAQAGRERHPLEPVVNEFQRQWGEIQVDLDQAQGRAFVEALLDSEPNRLDESFRETLTGHTGGHALFTVELLRGLQERGDLVRDADGRWAAGPALDWARMPARVEAVIAQRVGRLPAAWQTMLTMASVEGETFAAEVLARALGVDEAEVSERLSGPLSKAHRLVYPLRLEWLGDTLGAAGQVRRLSWYRFRHDLFQAYLYRRMDEVERARQHEAVGEALESLHAQHAVELETIAPQLAHHFEAAGRPAKAVAYLCRAGERALRLSAASEACVHFDRGLALLQRLPPSPERDRQELALQLGLGTAFTATQGWVVPQRAQVLARAHELAQRVGDTAQRLHALLALSVLSLARGEFHAARDWGQHLSDLAQQTQDPLYLSLAHFALGEAFYGLVELARARGHLERCIARYDPARCCSLGILHGNDVGVVCLTWLTWILQTMGYPDQALQRSREALALAREIDHMPSLGFALAFACADLHVLRREGEAVQLWLKELLQLLARQDLPLLKVWGGFLQGLGQVEQALAAAASPQLADPAGDVLCPRARQAGPDVGANGPGGSTHALQRLVQEGMAQMRRCLAAWQASGTRMGYPLLCLLMAGAYGMTGCPGQGLRLLDEMLADLERGGMRYYEAEMHRLKGDLLLMEDAAATGWQTVQEQAEACFFQAIEIARQREARLWELRATVSLCRLWQEGGRRQKARQMLSEIYGWFSEGLDTPDLQDARRLLEELAETVDA